MNIRKIILAGLMSLFLPAGFLYAHPPQHVRIQIMDTNISIEVTHQVDATVSSLDSHYVNCIEVFLNGNRMIEQQFGKQNGNKQVAVYTIPSLKFGDVIQAEAFCSQYGSYRGEAVVGTQR